MTYNKIVNDFFFQPRHIGKLDCSRSLTVCSRVGAGSGGFFDLCLSANAKGIIEKACFKAYGNPYLIAALELVCRQLEQCSIHTLQHLDYKILIEQLDIPKANYPVALLVVQGHKEVISKLKQLFEEKQE